MKGLIHSIETFGAADGPGVRYVIFVQGCNLRCKYCHNPDTWAKTNTEAKEYEASDLIRSALRYKSYWGSDGGITVSGGEPLLQIDFLIELFQLAKKEGIPTCIDTAGEPFSNNPQFLEKMDILLQYTDLVLLDIKHMDEDSHRTLTGKSGKNIQEFAKYLNLHHTPVWIRHVLVPGISDQKEEWEALRDFGLTMDNVQKVEVLPYHSLGVFKWKKLGIPYSLENTPIPDENLIKEAKKVLEIK